jgi:ABC-type transporter MlaC component
MRRTHRALVLLALSLSLVAATATVAAAAPPPATGIEDQHDRLLRSLQATQAERTEAAVQLHRSLERDLNRTAGVPLPAPIEDQHDRWLRNLEATRAEWTQAAVQLARAMERNLAPVPAVDRIAAQPAPRTLPAVPGRDVAVLTTLLVGLIGGLVGGAAAMAGWTAASRRRLHRAASAT